MRGAQAFVRRSDEASAGSDVFLQGDTNRFIHEESELAEKPVQQRALPRDREDKGTVGFHGLSLDTATCSTLHGEMAESEKPEGGWSSLFRMPRLNHLRNSLRVRSRDRLSVKQPAHRLQCHRHNKLRTLPRNRTMEPWDVTIVGGGILGTSFAYWLANRYDRRIAVLEEGTPIAMPTPRRHTSGVH